MASLRGALLSLGGSGGSAGFWSGILHAPAGSAIAPGFLLANFIRSSGSGGSLWFGTTRPMRTVANNPKQLSLYHSSSSSLWDRSAVLQLSHPRSLHTTTACLLTLTRHCCSSTHNSNLKSLCNISSTSNRNCSTSTIRNKTLENSSSSHHQFNLCGPKSLKSSHRFIHTSASLTSSSPFSPSQSQANYPEESQDSSEISSAKFADVKGVEVVYFRGLPQLTIPLPSRRERCRFVVKPLTNTVGDLLQMIRHEDKGVDRVAFHSTDGIRIASANTIEMLMERDFEILINDNTYKVKTPPQEKPSEEDLERLSSVRNLVGQLYGALNIDEHQLRKEREMLTELEKLQNEVHPMEDKREQINQLAIKRTNYMTWVGLGMMSVQFGILARLTWWEYSWDIMEPVTYFVTYGTAMLAYAYFVLTKQEYILPQVADRQYLLTFHKNAKKVGLDVDKYNRLKDQIHKIETDLRRLRDPLALHLPLKTRLVTQQELEEMIQLDESSQGIVAKASQRIQNLFKKSS